MSKKKKEPLRIKIADSQEVERYAASAPAGETERAADATDAKLPSDETDQHHRELERLRNDLESVNDKLLRARADHQNALKRSAAQMAETTRYANASLIQSLLGVLDDFERTLEHGEATEASTVLQGVKISYDRFMKVLTDHQVERIEATGKPFDPRYHEAMMQQPAEGAEPGTVLQELQRGYKLHDRVLRPTKVIVAGEPEQDHRTESTKDSTDTTSERQNPTSAAGSEKQ